VVVQRVKLPANYQVPLHTHPYAETGEMGKPGTIYAQPAKHAHYVWTGNEEAIIQVQFIGPGGIDYINPADDPRKK
jgi:hypothetical protein